jgi:hypothetical protein
MCGTPTSHLCRDCRNCEAYYWLAKRRMVEVGSFVEAATHA